MLVFKSIIRLLVQNISQHFQIDRRRTSKELQLQLSEFSPCVTLPNHVVENCDSSGNLWVSDDIWRLAALMSSNLRKIGLR